jgi:hypothetical protein
MTPLMRRLILTAAGLLQAFGIKAEDSCRSAGVRVKGRDSKGSCSCVVERLICTFTYSTELQYYMEIPIVISLA